eukprot:XP_001611729.1 SET domain containing protein [Babesia bovis T2Bo]
MLNSEEEDAAAKEAKRKAMVANQPKVLVEHRWSFLFPHSDQRRQSSSDETPSDDATLLQTPKHEEQKEPDDAKDACSSPPMLNVQDAWTSPEFGARSSLLRCLMVDMDVRLISRTQMNCAFHLAAIAKRLVHQGVYYMYSMGKSWKPIVSNEPVDILAAQKLTSLLETPVIETMKSQYYKQEKDAISKQIENEQNVPKKQVDGNDYEPDERSLKFQKLNESHAIRGTNRVNAIKDKLTEMLDDPASSTKIPTPKDVYLPEQMIHFILRAIYYQLAKEELRIPKEETDNFASELEAIMELVFTLIKRITDVDCSDELILGVIASIMYKHDKGNAPEPIPPFAKQEQWTLAKSGVEQPNQYSSTNTQEDYIVTYAEQNHKESHQAKYNEYNDMGAYSNEQNVTADNHIDLPFEDDIPIPQLNLVCEVRVAPFDPVGKDIPCYFKETKQQRCGESGDSSDKYSICRSKYVLCPNVYNEYTIFGGTPAIPPDMEFGTWIFDTPFVRLKVRDIPVLFHQQVQYSTKKYLTLADINETTMNARTLNLKLEFCGRGDWVFDDGSLPTDDADKEKVVHIKSVTADELLRLEFNGSPNQVAKKFFTLQKSFLSTAKEGTSRYIFMDPYANIDASICDDKDYSVLISELVSMLYKHNPDYYLASCNGYYYHEDGFLPETPEVQRIRNTLFAVEMAHYRQTMLADIIAEQRQLLGLTNKKPFMAKCKRVIIGKSRVHGYGLFAVDTINKGDLIMEYAGVVISDYMADMREVMYQRLVCGSIYMFRLDLNRIIDSTFYGNCARFINHSCDPNTATSNFSDIDEDVFGTHVGVYASKVILAGEEIYYNYRLSLGSENPQICRCGSYQCTGYMTLIKSPQ